MSINIINGILGKTIKKGEVNCNNNSTVDLLVQAERKIRKPLIKNNYYLTSKDR